MAKKGDRHSRGSEFHSAYWNLAELCRGDCVRELEFRARCIDTFWRPSPLLLFLFRLMDSGGVGRGMRMEMARRKRARKYLYSFRYSPLFPISAILLSAERRLRIRRNDKLSRGVKSAARKKFNKLRTRANVKSHLCESFKRICKIESLTG